MKAFCCTCILTILSISVSLGQGIRFGDPTNVWRIVVSCYGMHGAEHRYSGETKMAGGNLYRKLSGNYVYEDTVARKVFVLGDGDIPVLLYDWNLQTGDIFRPGSQVYVVDTTFVLSGKGGAYKVWRMRRPAMFSHTSLPYIIEEIGTVNGPFQHLSPDYDCTWDLSSISNARICLSVHDYGVSGAIPYLGICKGLGVSAPGNATQAIAIPNPVQASSAIVVPAALGAWTLQVTDITGRVVLRATGGAGETYRMGELLSTPGLYTYRFVTAGGYHQVGKLTVR